MNKLVAKLSKMFEFKYVLIGVIVVLLLLVILAPFHKVGVGERGIVYNSSNGKIRSEYLEQGRHFIWPFFEEMIVYPITPRTYTIERSNKNWLQGLDSSIWVPTSDNQKVSLDVSIVYQLHKDYLKTIYLNFKGESIDRIETDYMDDYFRGAIISVVTQNTIYDVYSQRRANIQNDICALLNKKLGPLGIEVGTVILKEVRLTPETESILLAETNRKAAVLEAEGKCEANNIINRSLTDGIIKLQTIEKLNSNLKLIVLPANTSNKLNINSLLNDLSGDAK